jgi:pimeloyl-ACP methyl ester carboxylesterase
MSEEEMRQFMERVGVLRRAHGHRVGTRRGPVDHPIRRNRSAWPTTPTALAGFINGPGLENPHVAGLSFGGALALALYVDTRASRGR